MKLSGPLLAAAATALRAGRSSLNLLLSAAWDQSATLPVLPSGERLELRTRDTKEAGVGGRVWASAPVLCDWLLTQDLRGERVLELGSGTGACGLFAAARGAEAVTLTDGGPDVLLELLASNVELNRRHLGAADVRCQRLNWGEGAEASLPADFSLVLGADVTYDDDAHAPLCKTLAAVLAAQPKAPPRVVLAVEHGAPIPVGKTFDVAGLFRDDGVDHLVAAAMEERLVVAPLGEAPAMDAFQWELGAFADAGPFLVEVSRGVP